MNKFLSLSIVALIASAGCGETTDDSVNNGTNNDDATVTSECLASDITGEFGGRVGGNVTFCGNVTIVDDVYNGEPTTVTIKPGTTIRFEVDRYFEMGWAGNEATLKALGTADKPIIFEGTTAARGHWKGIQLRSSVASDTVLQNVIVRHAGASDAPAILNESEHGILVKDVTIEEAAGVGVASSSFKSGSENLSVNNSEGPAVSLRSALAVTDFPIGGTFEANTNNTIQVDFGALKVDTVWHDPGVPYVIAEDIYNSNNVKFTIEPHVIFEFKVDKQLELGWAGNGIEVTINGTEEAPIIFRGTVNEASHWRGVIVASPAATSSTLKFLEIRNAGSQNQPALLVESAISINDVSMDTNGEPAVAIGAQGLKPGSTNLNIDNDSGASVVANQNAVFTLPTGGSYGSGSAYVALNDGTFQSSGTISKLDVPYRFLRSAKNTVPVTIEVETGTTMQFAADTLFELSWAGNAATFKADGVKFIGASETQGFWKGILVNSPTATGSYIKNSTISHAKDYGIVIDKDSGFEFTGNTVNQTTGVCVGRPPANTADFAGTNTLTCSDGEVADY